MAADIFDSRTMLEMVEQKPAPGTFLLDTLFSRVEVSDSEYVDIDIVKQGRKLAPFVAPEVEGKVIENEGYTTNTYKPPYVKPKKVTRAGDLMKRLAGEAPYGGISSSERGMKRLADDLVTLDEIITRREEWMAAQVLRTGSVTCIGDGVNTVIDFGLSASHKVTLAGGDLWSDAASDPIADLVAWVKLVRQDSGVNPNIMIGSSDAIEAFLGNASVEGRLDTRRIELGQIVASELANGAAPYGRIVINGAAIDVYSYDEWYDDGGTVTPLLDSGRIILTSTMADYRRNYGGIQDVEAGGSSLSLSRFPKSWVTPDPSARWVMVQSAPLPALHQADALVTATVL